MLHRALEKLPTKDGPDWLSGKEETLRAAAGSLFSCPGGECHQSGIHLPSLLTRHSSDIQAFTSKCLCAKTNTIISTRWWEDLVIHYSREEVTTDRRNGS